MKTLNHSELLTLFKEYFASFKLIDLKESDTNNKTISILQDNFFDSFKSIGRFFLLIDVNAPANITGLDSSMSNIHQQWELIEEIKENKRSFPTFKIKEKSFLKFKSWGAPPLMEYEGRELLIPTEIFIEFLILIHKKYPEKYSIKNLSKTVGLENVKLQ